MQDYSFSDINEAKRRVQEMKSRAREKTGDEPKTDELSLIFSLASQKEKAFALSLLYLLTTETVSDDFLLFIIYLIKYGN